MQIDKDLISKLEKLAKLNLSEEERLSITKDLNQILDMVNVLRKDEIKNQLPRKEALSNAPDKDEQFFKVPKVIKK